LQPSGDTESVVGLKMQIVFHIMKDLRLLGIQ